MDGSASGRRVHRGPVGWALLCGCILAAGCCAPPAQQSQGLAGGGEIAAAGFPGPADFPGTYTPRPGAVMDGLQSTYEGALIVTMLDRILVEKVLAPGLALGKAIDPTQSRHPVILLMGTQHEPSRVSQGVASPIGTATAYREVILMVPFAMRALGTRYHNYVVRMYLNDLSAVIGGNVFFGYNKEFARVDATGPAESRAYNVASVLGEAYFTAQVDAAVPAAAPSRWSDLATMLAMPILGVESGQFVCSYWEWDTNGAQIAAASSRQQFLKPFVAGMQDWMNLGSVASAPEGAVAIQGMRWRIAWEPPPWQPPACAF